MRCLLTQKFKLGVIERNGHEIAFFSMAAQNNFDSKWEKYFISNVNYENRLLKDKVASAVKLLYSFEAKRKIEELIKKEERDIAYFHNINA